MMYTERLSHRYRATITGPLTALAAWLAVAAPLGAADIGVLRDPSPARQAAGLSLLDLAAARQALEADGHQIIEIASLDLPVLRTVDVVWLPLLAAPGAGCAAGDCRYTAQERTNLVTFLNEGGRIIWIGDADVFNTGDQSFLDLFGAFQMSLTKLSEQRSNAIGPAITDHPAVTGPFGPVNTIGTSAAYGLFSSDTQVADVFVGDPAPGTVVGLIDSSSGFTGSGRIALLSDATMFGQLLQQDDHLPLLRNIVAWVAAEPGYTPNGTTLSVVLPSVPGACQGCSDMAVEFPAVSATGQTWPTQVFEGRCGDPALSDLPVDFLGYGFSIHSTAVYTGPVTVTVTFDPAPLASLGITDPSQLMLWWDDGNNFIQLTNFVIDVGAGTARGDAPALGAFLLGAPVAGADCNGNGLIDECEPPVTLTIDVDPVGAGGTAPSGSVSANVCDMVAIAAIPATGFCFERWTVGAGALPAAPNQAQTQVLADFTKTVTAHFRAVLVGQPTDWTGCQGAAATFTVQTDPNLGTTPTYQWRKDGTNLVDDGRITGALTHTLATDPVEPGDEGVYTCVVNYACAGASGSVTSDPAALAVLTGPVIDQQPQDVGACEGTDATFTVMATGTGTLTYQWLRDTVPIAGATGPTLTLTGVQPADDGAQFTCEVADSCGTTTTVAATLTVYLEPVVTVDPTLGGVCEGSDLTLTATSVGTAPFTYQWRKDSADIPGATAASWTIASATPSDAGDYEVVVTNQCAAVTSQPVTVTVHPDRPTITQQPQNVEVCAGPNAAATFGITATGTGPLSYLWYRDGAAITGATSDTLTLSNVQPADSGAQFTCEVTDQCGAMTSDPATLTVNIGPTIQIQPVGQAACDGDPSLTLSVDAVGTSPLAYQWNKDGVAIVGATDSVYTIAPVGPGAAGVYDVDVSNTCGSVTSDAATVTVHGPALITGQPVSASVCDGGLAQFSIVATGANPAYQWQFDGHGQGFVDLTDDGRITGATTAGLSVATAGPADNGQYRCRMASNCGPTLTSDAATLTVTAAACDCNNNGVPDGEDIASGFSADCNTNGVPDECDISEGRSLDCNTNAVPDECDLASGVSPDCNANAVPDECDLAAGTSSDCNADTIPDECQLAGNDCNGNGVPDDCDPPYLADAGLDRSICVGQPTPLGGAVVATGSTPPYLFSWRIIAGPAGGATVIGPTTERPSFVANAAGTYDIELEVTDSSTPPCITTDVVNVTTDALSVDAGAGFDMCVETTSAALTATVTGGAGPYTYLWSIDAGSPSTSLDQFTGTGPQSPAPSFTPDAPGVYSLRVTVSDINGTACTATDTMTIAAGQLSVSAPPNIAMCVNADSAPLSLTISTPDPLAVICSWEIEPGSPDMNPGQFGGSGPTSTSPTFHPTSLGDYVLRATVQDAATPPCERSVTMLIRVVSMTVDAGATAGVCVGGEPVRLSPAVTGGYGEYRYSWTVEPGSPSLDPGQFDDPSAFGATPLFTPSSQGAYTLRLTVRDSATPVCEASDTVLVRVGEMIVDAGEDFVTQAFRPSRGLGALPLVAGGTAPHAFHWTILSGPTTADSQFDDARAEHPLFTPSMTGTYRLAVTVTSADGVCVGSDELVIEAITSSIALAVNVEGRVFMNLQIDRPHTRAEVRVSNASVGGEFRGELVDAGPRQFPAGETRSAGPTRRLIASSDLTAGTYVAVIVMHFGETESATIDESSLRLLRLDNGGRWRTAGILPAEDGPFPVRAGRADLSRHGIDATNNCAWAVLDHVGQFAVGVPLPTTAPAEPIPTGPTDDIGPQPGGAAGEPPAADPVMPAAPLCGLMGPTGAIVSLTCVLFRLGTLSRKITRSRRRKRPLSGHGQG